MKDLFASLRSFLTPKDLASWQTFMLLSIFSVVMGAFMSSLAQGIVSSFGWFFLIVAVWWFVYGKDVQTALTFNAIFTKVFLGPWIISTLIVLAVF